jgi:hypothetical protein
VGDALLRRRPASNGEVFGGGLLCGPGSEGGRIMLLHGTVTAVGGPVEVVSRPS